MNFSFFTNLFGDTNVAHILCKSTQTCKIEIQNNSYFGMERVYLRPCLVHENKSLGNVVYL